MLAFSLRSWSPTAILVAGFAVAGAVAALSIGLTLTQPWLGLRLGAAPDDASGLQVLAARGPGAAIPEGTVLTSVARPGDAPLTLDDGDITPEPDTRYARVDAYRRFLRDQQALHEQIAAGTVLFRDRLGHTYRVTPATRRPWQDLPASFWLQVLVAVSGFLVGVGVWTFRRADPAAGYLAVTGVGLLISAASAAVYSSRELALSWEVFRIAHAVNGTGSLLFCAAFMATLWHYPTRLGRFDPGPLLIAGYLLLTLFNVMQWSPSFDIGLRLPILLGYSATIVLAVLQWRRTRQRPLDRAALQWFLLAWFSGSTAFLALVFVPALFGVDTGALQAYAFALFLLIYIGVAFGIVRYRLFQLDRWWLNAWSFLLLLVLLLAASLTLFFVLEVDPLIAGCLAIASTGWLYLPLQHRLSGRRRLPRFEKALPQLLQQVVDSGATSPDALWRETLSRLFRPLDLRAETTSLPRAVVDDNGLVLRIPDVGGRGSLRLTGCESGMRLFTEHDQSSAEAMRSVIERLLDYGRAVELGVERERLRVSRDLHDDIGAKLLELLHRCSGPTQDRVRAILDELRLVTASLGSRGETLEDLLGICRAEAGERLEGTEIALQWRQADDLPEIRLSPQQALLIVRSLREGIENVRLHALQARRVEVEVRCDATHIMLHLKNDHPHRVAETPADGRTLISLRSRAAALGGDLITAASDAGWELTLTLPWSTLH